jgi:hypothetical protein
MQNTQKLVNPKFTKYKFESKNLHQKSIKTNQEHMSSLIPKNRIASKNAKRQKSLHFFIINKLVFL